MQAEKPHKGVLHHWSRRHIDEDLGLGWCAYGFNHAHPDWGGGVMRTSYVVKHDEATGEIETRNSRYTLIGPEQA